MFDIGWTEMALVAMVAILVIGPKELPRVLRNMGRAMGKARSLAREFRKNIDEMAEEVDVNELLPKASDYTPESLIGSENMISADDFSIHPPESNNEEDDAAKPSPDKDDKGEG
ncbi:MAG: twin-arginine translocase subunit TatB [Rhodospirillaceae bacterium]|jgi:sec-independent protein translocase protein TatB|nr:twin-arginine translocase subunit TatB [Rhodospirillaceae bacterium]MBT5374435.1 twin-arginine translocase subunit TatB [Rhodospirillaceae bacterium]MBT5660342.1 twin-arginine translocase subunit TatB [Rhodospirillaceae bacterium]MBT5751934.1 twin-arginine translocase subunit TatB [Rhodospirillaceae bacterium]